MSVSETSAICQSVRAPAPALARDRSPRVARRHVGDALLDGVRSAKPSRRRGAWPWGSAKPTLGVRKLRRPAVQPAFSLPLVTLPRCPCCRDPRRRYRAPVVGAPGSSSRAACGAASAPAHRSARLRQPDSGQWPEDFLQRVKGFFGIASSRRVTLHAQVNRPCSPLVHTSTPCL